jgi:SAM-dependent methyltransferase
MGPVLEPSPAPKTLPMPTVLHVGSGKNFLADWLNLDIDDRWRPDIVHDIGTPLPPDGRLTFATRRFGSITIGDETFDEILAQDVLEHVHDLPAAMTTILRLLKTGGVLKAVVPYDLSLGAWSDPTHVRAFNERSFEYYTKWSWYLSWRTHHFKLRHIEYVTSEYGQELSAAGRSLEEVLRTPRAVDQMYAELEKQELDEAGRETTDWYLQRPLL